MLPPMGRLRARTASRLWPTRRLFETRYLELADQVGELRVLVAQIAEEQRARLVALDASQASRGPGGAPHPPAADPGPGGESLRGSAAMARAARGGARGPGYERAYRSPEPLVSVAISTYHSPDTLCDRALASVLAQTHSNWEGFVVGDHCTDDTESRVRALGDERIRWHNLAVRENDPDDPWERWAVKGSVPRATAVSSPAGAGSHRSATTMPGIPTTWSRCSRRPARHEPRSCTRRCAWCERARAEGDREPLGRRVAAAIGPVRLAVGDRSTAPCASFATTGRARSRPSPTTGTSPGGRGRRESASHSCRARLRRCTCARRDERDHRRARCPRSAPRGDRLPVRFVLYAAATPARQRAGRDSPGASAGSSPRRCATSRTPLCRPRSSRCSISMISPRSCSRSRSPFRRPRLTSGVQRSPTRTGAVSPPPRRWLTQPRSSLAMPSIGEGSYVGAGAVLGAAGRIGVGPPGQPVLLARPPCRASATTHDGAPRVVVAGAAGSTTARSSAQARCWCPR